MYSFGGRTGGLRTCFGMVGFYFHGWKDFF